MVVIEFGVFLKKIFDIDLYLILIIDFFDKFEGFLEVGNIIFDFCVFIWNVFKVSVIFFFVMYMFYSVVIGKILFEKKKRKENFDFYLKCIKKFF